MAIVIDRKLLIYLGPVLLLCAAAFAPRYLTALDETDQRLAVSAPYLASAIGIFLALYFHRGRPFIALALLTLFYLACRTKLAAGSSGLAAQSTIYAYAVLLPISTLVLAVFKERGLLT